MGKREVWVVERDGEPLTAFDEGEEVQCLARKATAIEARMYKTDDVTRYIPAPERVEGWPTQEGAYWMLTPNRTEPWLVYADANMISTAGHTYGVFRTEGLKPGTRLWGPLLPPKVEAER